MAESCRYNIKEFAPFTSGKKRIKPALASDWEVSTGGFQCSNDVLNLYSPSLNQRIFDIYAPGFFNFMKNEGVTMNGDKIVGSYAIGSGRVLRKEEDYLATMATVTERKSIIIAKKDMIVGNKYETVCGSTFIFAGTRYFIKGINNKSGIKLTKNKKYYLSFGTSNWQTKSKISDVTSKKVVKDLGPSKKIEELDKAIEHHIKVTKDIIFCSEKLEKPIIEMDWEETNIKIISKSGSYYDTKTPDYMMDNDGFVWNKENDNYSYKVKYFLLQEDDNGTIVKGTDYFTLDTYDNNTERLKNFKSVQPVWKVKETE